MLSYQVHLPKHHPKTHQRHLRGPNHRALGRIIYDYVNPEQTKVLYDKALEYADLNGEESVIDAYCGIGTIFLEVGDL